MDLLVRLTVDCVFFKQKKKANVVVGTGEGIERVPFVLAIFSPWCVFKISSYFIFSKWEKNILIKKSLM